LGTLIIKPQFDYGNEFSDGLAKIKINQKYGFIDNAGKIIINPQFDDIGNFYEGLAKVKVSGKFGFVNKKGEIVIKPEFEDVNNFSEDYARVIEKSDFWTKKGGYIDKSGHYKISYEGADFEDFSEGLAAVNINGKFGYINKKSEIVINPQFSYVFPFREGIAWVCTSKEIVGVMASLASDVKWGCIDKKGNFIIPYQKFYWPNSFFESLSSVNLIEQNGINKWGFIDKTGNIIIQPQFDLPGYFHEGLASVKVGDKYGFINRIGKFILDPIFDGAWDFNGGIAKVLVGKSNAYIDKMGNWVWNPLNLQIAKQTIQTDEKISFKSLRIGDNKSKYSGSLSLISTDKNTSTYQYTPPDDDLYNLFDLRINKITLLFDNNHLLIEIILIKSYSGSNSMQDAYADARKIDPNMKNLFGKQTGIIDINTTAELKLGRVWKSNNVTVKAYTEDYGMGNGTDLKVTITDNIFIQQSIKSGF
jgi:hypothetical protein